MFPSRCACSTRRHASIRAPERAHGADRARTPARRADAARRQEAQEPSRRAAPAATPRALCPARTSRRHSRSTSSCVVSERPPAGPQLGRLLLCASHLHSLRCPEPWALSRASRLASSLREPWRVPYDECVLIAPFDEHSHALDDHRLGVLYREAVGELIAEAFPAPDGCQVITGISECILGAKLLAPWGARPECQAPLHD